MEDPPKDPRVVAMLTALLGSEWDKLEGEVRFDESTIESWVMAAETMLAAADGVDPIRVAIRGLMGEASSGRTEAAMPKPE